MKQNLKKCNKCEYTIIEEMQLDWMLGMDTAKLLSTPNYEHDYECLKIIIESYINDFYLKDNINDRYFNCGNCDTKLGVEETTKYYNKILNVINCDQYDSIDKLREIDFLDYERFRERCAIEYGVFSK